MRKTSIALFIAVVASPVALANSYYNPYGYDDKENTISDSFNKTLDADLYVTKNNEYTKKVSYSDDSDKLLMYDVNNTDEHKYIDNSMHDYSQDWDVTIKDTYNVASSYLDGMVTYSKVEYGAGCCGGGHGYYGKGGHGYSSSDPSMLTVNHTNDMSGAFSGASGVNLAGQNAGNNSLLQQTASTNATLAGN
ncbi:hypothetical protein C9I98_01175 [Photobacterium sanctipauli]|uniref:Uncharacterized protein n=1 Tax=Photobacterium sanctipauli TaxID=1342794 RepID=A0A2T3P0B1_9GAMM|nr:hypothetical protein [Photobacterium sanctipauli]PSW21908.1 hypothetical protein C9I98_01175 [Photobacterium sanctipauli]